MVFFHRPLCLEADQYRQALVDWATTHAESQTDYTLDAKGNRLYYNEKIAPHVIPLMRAMGCAVCKTTPATLLCDIAYSELKCVYRVGASRFCDSRSIRWYIRLFPRIFTSFLLMC